MYYFQTIPALTHNNFIIHHTCVQNCVYMYYSSRFCLNTFVCHWHSHIIIIPPQIQLVTIQFQPILNRLSLPTVGLYRRVFVGLLRMFLLDEPLSTLVAYLRPLAHMIRQQRGLTSFSLTSKYLLFPKTDDNDTLEGNPCRAVYTTLLVQIRGRRCT